MWRCCYPQKTRRNSIENKQSGRPTVDQGPTGAVQGDPIPNQVVDHVAQAAAALEVVHSDGGVVQGVAVHQSPGRVLALSVQKKRQS